MIWFACKQCGKRHGRAEGLVGTPVFCECGQGNRVPQALLPAMKVYNLHVEGLNNHAVGHLGVLVHNKNGPPRISGMREWEVVPGQEARAARTVQQLEADYFRAMGRRPVVLDADHPQGALGRIDPKTGHIELYSGERFGPAARAEELFHYQQLRARGLLGKTEAEIGPKVIQEIEQEVEILLRNAGFRPRR